VASIPAGTGTTTEDCDPPVNVIVICTAAIYFVSILTLSKKRNTRNRKMMF
jgi:hypothetical protein